MIPDPTPHDPWIMPAPQHPIPQQPIPQQPVLGQPITHQPAPGQPITHQPAPGQPIPQQPITHHPIPWQPIMPDRVAPGSLPPDRMPPGPVMIQIGEMAVTSTVVHTPAGDIALAGSTWTVNDYWHSEQQIPPWAIAAAIVGFCVLTVFSLLFLLVKVTVPRGTVQVTVTNATRQCVARIAVTNPSQVTYVHQQVNYVRYLASL